jgi:hypothetical protein
MENKVWYLTKENSIKNILLMKYFSLFYPHIFWILRKLTLRNRSHKTLHISGFILILLSRLHMFL